MYGAWSGNYWMPPQLYFYMNFGTIRFNESIMDKNKALGRPKLRDIDWEFCRGWCEARGFSGFEGDHLYTCNRSVLNPTDPLLRQRLTPNCYKADGTLKEYINPRDYMAWYHNYPKGKPLWENEAKNFMMLGSRGFGKSYGVANMVILHEWLFAPKGTEILVGAGEAKYSNNLMALVKLSLEHIPGGMYYNDTYYPAPFSKQYKGSWKVGSTVVAEYKAKYGRAWVTKGSRNMIHHRTFADNPTAANGLRCSVMVFEEIGMFKNLEESLGASVPVMEDSGNKFGSAMLLGTGGDMEGGGTLAAQKMFYDPEAYNLVVFEDKWEGRGSIAYFVPAYRANSNFKKVDPIGKETWVSDEDAAQQFVLDRREEKKKDKSTKPLDDFIIAQPLVPSEVFLSTNGNIFPITLLKDQLNKVMSNNVITNSMSYGHMEEQPDGSIKFVKELKPDPINTWPIAAGTKSDGCVCIYEFPPKDEDIPYGMYVAGCDPYAQDKSASSTSVGAVYIYKRFQEFDRTYDIIVAEYVGRPNTLMEFHEQVRMLLKYYNAVCLYENQFNNLHAHMVVKGCDYLLADQPDQFIKDTIRDSTVKRGKGIHMTKQIKDRAANLLRDWLMEVRYTDPKTGTVYTNIDYIYSVGLLTELIMYNDEGNFDRVIAFMCVIMLNYNKHKVRVQEIKEQAMRDPFWDKKLFVRKSARL